MYFCDHQILLVIMETLDCMEDTCLLRVFPRFVSMGNGHMLVVPVGVSVTAPSSVGSS